MLPLQITLYWSLQNTLCCPLQVPYVAITMYPIQPKLCTLNAWTILDIKLGFLIKEQNICNKYNQHAINYLKASQLPL